MSAGHALAIPFDTLFPLLKNADMPSLAGSFVGKYTAGERGGPQHIEVMHFAEQVLHVLQIVAPQLVLGGKEIFDNVAKAFDANAQGMERDLRPVAQSTRVEFTGSSPAFEGQVFEHRASRPDVGGARRQGPAPLAPLFAVEFVEGCASLMLLFILATVEDFE